MSSALYDTICHEFGLLEENDEEAKKWLFKYWVHFHTLFTKFSLIVCHFSLFGAVPIFYAIPSSLIQHLTFPNFRFCTTIFIYPMCFTFLNKLMTSFHNNPSHSFFGRLFSFLSEFLPHQQRQGSAQTTALQIMTTFVFPN